MANKSTVMWTGKPGFGFTAAETLFQISEDQRKQKASEETFAKQQSILHQNAMEKQDAANKFTLGIENLKQDHAMQLRDQLFQQSQQQALAEGAANLEVGVAQGRGAAEAGVPMEGLFRKQVDPNNLEEGMATGEPPKPDFQPTVTNPLAGKAFQGAVQKRVDEELREKFAREQGDIAYGRDRAKAMLNAVTQDDVAQWNSLGDSLATWDPANSWTPLLKGARVGQAGRDQMVRIAGDAAKYAAQLKERMQEAQLMSSTRLKIAEMNNKTREGVAALAAKKQLSDPDLRVLTGLSVNANRAMSSLQQELKLNMDRQNSGQASSAEAMKLKQEEVLLRQQIEVARGNLADISVQQARKLTAPPPAPRVSSARQEQIVREEFQRYFPKVKVGTDITKALDEARKTDPATSQRLGEAIQKRLQAQGMTDSGGSK